MTNQETRKRETSDRVRAWRVLKSFQLALTVGGLTGMIVIGLTSGKFVGDLESRESLLVGAGVAVGLTLVLTYVFDQVSKSVKSFTRATKGQKGGSEEERQR